MARIPLTQVAAKEKSHNVALLHRVLETFGLTVSKKEVDENRAGSDTQEKVRALQSHLNVHPDESSLVDEATIAAIREALRSRGLTDASRSFTVSGTVRLRDGSVRRRQRLLAFDLDLRGIAAYRTTENVAELQETGGFEFLGQASSDARGTYEITFYDWQYRRAERKQADVVVYAVEEGRRGGRIVGRSRLVRSEDYSDEGLVRDLHVLIAASDEGIEYELLMSALSPFLKESETSLREIAASAEQLAFTADELDVDLAHLNVAAAAKQLSRPGRSNLSHELLYGLGRQGMRLDWTFLLKRTDDELRSTIASSVEERIIQAFDDDQIAAFIEALRSRAVESAIEEKETDEPNPLNAMLSHALPQKKQRLGFVNAVATFRGSNAKEFWSEHLPAQAEFKDNPQLISKLLVTRQLTALTGNHQPLVGELQGERRIESVTQLLDLQKSDWLRIIDHAGLPDWIDGNSEDERAEKYADAMESLLNASLPTQRIARMVDGGEIPIERTSVSQGVSRFLSRHVEFDFASSRVHDFDAEIEAEVGLGFADVRDELMKIQRVFQVSTNPDAMKILLQNNLHSAHAIASIPRKTFMKTYGDALGGEQASFAIHQRAEHVSTRAELVAMHLLEYSQGIVPESVIGSAESAAAMAVLQNRLPNYAQLFGSPDICECEHCRSVHSAAAYFIDLLRFLWRGEPNSDGKTPLDILAVRRPDLLHLPLTCENTNTIIPYIDLANEVMEYYTAHDTLTGFTGHDTGEATPADLRANPQNFNLEAYRKLKDAKYPFSLPYHQPLDEIRTYADHLKVSRAEAMRAATPVPDSATQQAIAAEGLSVSEEEHKILTGRDLAGAVDATPLHEYYGYASAPQLENLSAVPEFLHRTGVRYPELVELLRTQFINPHQHTLDLLQRILSFASISADVLYARLEQIEAGTLDPATDADIVAALNAYNGAQGTNITAADFGQWVIDHLDECRRVITLYEPDSKCALETTELRTIRSIYEAAATSGLVDDDWSRIHRFIRLWRKLGWSIHETDLVLAAIAAADITPETIGKLESISRLRAATKLPLNKLAVLWGHIDTYGKKSLYGKLFLNKSVQQIDQAFEADAWGNYLDRSSEILGDHRSAILAGLRIRDQDLAAILDVAHVIDGGNPRPIDFDNDVLSLAHLSTIYRYVVLAKALKLRVPDACKLMLLFGPPPFSNWDVQLQTFSNAVPRDTYEFFETARTVKTTGFKTATLQYILNGTVPADSRVGLDRDRALQTAQAIRGSFSTIDQEHPETPPSPLTPELLGAKLTLTFQTDVVNRLMRILEGAVRFETVTDANLNVTVPENLKDVYTYVKGSGRLTCAGVMSDGERSSLLGLANANFDTAVNELYQAPEDFLSVNFGGVLSNLAEANEVLLDHPSQATPATLEEKLAYVYERFIPVLKHKLRRDTLAQHIAALVGLSETATSLLMAADTDTLLSNLSTEGFSATYFSDATWTNAALERVDEEIDFDWALQAPHALVPADNFSVRWHAYVSPPATGEYTVTVDLEQADESLKLYLDDVLILDKAAADPNTSWEAIVTLNSARMHTLRLEYADITQNAGVRLRWKTATTAPGIVPSSAAYPRKILDEFVDLAVLYHRAAAFVTGFDLSETELAHFLAFPADFDGIDFKALTAVHWKRIKNYTALRNAVPQVQALLTDVFESANTSNPAPAMTDLKDLLQRATAWEESNLDHLIDSHFALGIADFKNEVALNRLLRVMQIVVKTGLSASTVTEWGAVETDFDRLHATAQRIKRAVKAKYEEADWLSAAGELSDKIRENQKQALVAYLLTRPAVRAWGAHDADSLFEYLLIDVQMDPCMDTSRVVQANASVQMFVERCLLNLESDMSSGAEQGVSPGAIDRDRWEWMRYYRVWEANRKVFLYPENWLFPEWRNDRSEFFKDLESYLVQNDITERSVEQAFRNYLTSLNEVANLEVCGLHREDYDDGSLKFLHVFGRTHNLPYKFFYRRWNQYGKWSAWEKVPVDIRSVDGEGGAGVHLAPVAWKKRLFLFWPEFMQVQEEQWGNRNKSVEQLSQKSTSELEARKYWEVRLAWSEYVDGKWLPKQVSKEIIEHWPARGSQEKDVLVSARVTTDRLHIDLSSATRDRIYRYGFTLSDIQSPVERPTRSYILPRLSDHYSFLFSRRFRSGDLKLLDDVYLRSSMPHTVLPVDTITDLDIGLDDPFFFSDRRRTYFVRPVDIRVLEDVKKPEVYIPRLPDLERARKIPIPIPIDVPELGPGNPPPIDRPPFDVGDALPLFLAGVDVPAMASLADRPVAARGVPAASSAAVGSLSSTMVMSGESIVTKTATTDVKVVDSAFAGASRASVIGRAVGWHYRSDTGLEFHTFYHPFSSDYVSDLNLGGLDRLMVSDISIPSDQGATFEDVYDPNFSQGFVQKPADFSDPDRTYYKENVCFDVYGANSLYNWELFFHAPLYIATRLSKNGKYEEAMKWFHYIFDPTTDDMPGPGESDTSRYWKVLPFKTTPAESLESWFRSLSPSADPDAENAIIAEWRDNPFDPHLVATNRPLAYMKRVVIAYVENLIAWADSLFRIDTRETVNEALQLYVIANHILGRRPEFVPNRGGVKAESYESLKDKWDDFSNALVELENLFPYSSEASVSGPSSGTSLLGVGSALYFCIPPNKKLLDYWDTVADRLYKIRHCQNIDGVERHLALFAPPIDPAALIQAASQGLSLGSILADLSSPPPIYRFRVLIQKANEFCVDVRELGSTLLAVLEKKDAEELARLRASHESQILESIRAVRQRQILEAKANKENLVKARETAEFRLQHYIDLLGNDSVTIPASPTIAASLTDDSPLPADTNLAVIEADVDESLVDSDESGIKLIAKEKADLDKSRDAMISQQVASAMEGLAGLLHLIPGFDADGKPLGIGAGVSYGGPSLGAATSGLAKVPQIVGAVYSHEAAQAAKTAGFIRREQDWTLQANLAAKEITQLDKQITSADIRIQVAEKELENHEQQIANAKEVELFLADKFTNQELYQWIKEQLFAVYKQSYNLAYDMSKKAEKAFNYEMGTQTASFIQYGYWDNSKQGLASGEKLQLALRQLEKSYLEEDRRELELTKNVSLTRLDPLALIELRETGKCYVSLPEELFDLDFRGHYFRRIKSVRLSIPCVAGPYTSINCSLRLLNNSVRINTSMNSQGEYQHENDEGMWIDDSRFVTSRVPVTAIATSTAQNDPGLFELSFGDERYLPFEGAGAISGWNIELSGEKELRQLDHSTISDVILHLDYTARESGGLFKEKAAVYLKDFIANSADLENQPFIRMFDMKHELPNEWHLFFHPRNGPEQALSFTVGKERFPFLAANREIVVMEAEILAKCSRPGDYHLVLSYVNRSGDVVTSSQIVMPKTPEGSTYGGLHKATLRLHDAGLSLDELDIAGAMTLKLKHSTATDFASLETDPQPEIEDMFLVVHYKSVDSV